MPATARVVKRAGSRQYTAPAQLTGRAGLVDFITAG